MELNPLSEVSEFCPLPEFRFKNVGVEVSKDQGSVEQDSLFQQELVTGCNSLDYQQTDEVDHNQAKRDPVRNEDSEQHRENAKEKHP